MSEEFCEVLVGEQCTPRSCFPVWVEDDRPKTTTSADITILRVGAVTTGLAGVSLVTGTAEVIDAILALPIVTGLAVALIDVILTAITTEPRAAGASVLVHPVSAGGVIGTLIILTVVCGGGLQLILYWQATEGQGLVFNENHEEVKLTGSHLY